MEIPEPEVKDCLTINIDESKIFPTLVYSFR